MKAIVVFVITLTMAGVVCALVSSVEPMSVQMAQLHHWQSGSDKRQEKRDGRLLNRSLSDGRGRLKRNSDNTRLYKDALFTSPNQAYFQKHQTHHLQCPSWRHEERLSSVFWYSGSTHVVEYHPPNERGRNFTDGARYQLDGQMGLIIHNVTEEDWGVYDCRVVPTATKRERQGKVTVKILDSTFPANVVSMSSKNESQNINRQSGGRIKCPHSTTDSEGTYWSLDRGEGVDTEIIGAKYSNKDTLVLDKFKDNYQIVNGGDLKILSLQRPQSRFWCHRFLNGMAVGYVDVTGVVVANQDKPTISGCEPLPGIGYQVDFDPDKDLQLICSVLKVYPKVTLDWKVVSKCDVNFQETSTESFDDVTKTYDQYQQLTVKAGSFYADCQPKFVCNATGVAIPAQHFGAEVQVKSGATWTNVIIVIIVIIVILVVVSTFLFSTCRLVFYKRKFYHLKKYANSANVEANEKESDDIGCRVDDCDVEVHTKEHVAKQQSCDDDCVVEVDSKEHAGKQQSFDESKTLMPKISQSEETKPVDESEHVEIHPSSSNSFSPRKWLMQAHNIVVHIHQYVEEKTPKRNHTKPKQKKTRKGGTGYQSVWMETDTAGQRDVRLRENSRSPLLSKETDSTLEGVPEVDVASVTQEASSLFEASDPHETLDLNLTHDERSPQETSDLFEACDPRDTSEPHLRHDERSPQESDPQQMSFSEPPRGPPQKLESQQGINEVHLQQQISDEANSDPHPAQDEVNPQLENPPEISEAGPSDPSIIGETSQINTSTASDDKASEIQNGVLQDANQQSNAPEQSPAGLGKSFPKHGQTDGKFVSTNIKIKNKKKPSNSNKRDKESSKLKGVDEQAARNSKQPLERSIDNKPDEGTEPGDFGRDDLKDQSAAEERSTGQSTGQQVTEPVDNQHSDDVQGPHREDPSQQPDQCNSTPVQQVDPITKQPSSSLHPFQSFSSQGSAPDNQWEKEVDPFSVSVPNVPPNDTIMQHSPPLFTSPGSNTISRGLDDSPNHFRNPQPVLPPQSNHRGPTSTGLDSNGSNRLPSDDDDMASVKSESSNEMGDDVYRDVSDPPYHDVSNVRHKTPSMEVDEAIAGENQKAFVPDIEMGDSQDEVVERPKLDRRERRSDAESRRKKQNPLKKKNILDMRKTLVAV